MYVLNGSNWRLLSVECCLFHWRAAWLLACREERFIFPGDVGSGLHQRRDGLPDHPDRSVLCLCLSIHPVSSSFTANSLENKASHVLRKWHTASSLFMRVITARGKSGGRLLLARDTDRPEAHSCSGSTSLHNAAWWLISYISEEWQTFSLSRVKWPIVLLVLLLSEPLSVICCVTVWMTGYTDKDTDWYQY